MKRKTWTTPLRIKWKRYPTVEALHAMWPDEDIEMSDGSVWSWRKYLDSIKRMGMHAFTEQGRKVPVVHYWHDGRRKTEELIFMLAHEIGHNLGRPLRGLDIKTQCREEDRADEYALAAREAFMQVKKEKTR